jgi:acyl-CoA reductase-like NAD-dependent aldehyde dehydrogenase
LDHQDLIARTACLDSGKSRIDASFGEILVTVAKLRWTIEHGERALQASERPTSFLMFYKKNEVRYEPLGVVAACVSWNYPFHNLLGPVISALFTGNAIVIKGSERTAWSSFYFASIAQEALKACGHSPNLVQSIVCWPATASHLISHPDIAHLTFIGSREVAREVAASASKSLTPLCLELGGKDPAIVLDDVKDIDRVVATLARGVFQSAGQNCIGIERIICQSHIYETVIDRLKPIVESLISGSSLHSARVDVGASISDANFGLLELFISDAVKKGARLLVGGKRLNHQEFPSGHYFSPTLLVDVTPGMTIAHIELFAPVCVVMKAESVDEAINIANGTDYALGASVFGSNSATLEKVTRELKAGMVAINDFGVYYVVQLPFGGVKGSGYGRFVGNEGLRSLCNIKSVCKDRWPSLIKTSIPGPLRLPIMEEERGWNMCKGMVELGYSDSLWRRLRGLGRITGL